MSKNLELNEKIKSVVSEKNVFMDEPMKNHTSFKVGGPVDIMVIPETFDELQKVIKLCISDNSPYFIIGNGSNLLVKDKGIRGVVIKLTSLNTIKVDGCKIIAQSGALIGDVSQRAMEESLTGFEFACGIPGSVGGAVAMNAGAYISEVANIIESTLVIDNKGRLIYLSKDELDLGYRTSAILKYGYTVIEATFKLCDGDQSKVKSKMEDLQKRRQEKQPLEFPSAGSTFKRPEGYFAGKLIEDAGLKGLNVGGAEVSTKHSGFIINKGSANAKDVLDLIALVQKKVHAKYNVELHPEVLIVGED